VGGQTNYNAYAELGAPIFKGFELDAAVRYDHYNTYGGSTTPKFGVKYTPFEFITLRGTYGKGFRAPNPAEAGQSGALFGGAPFNDASLCPNPANPQAAGNFPTQCNRGLVGLQVSNPQLQPEKSTNWTAGIIVNPVRDTSISIDYWDIKVNQDIQSGVNVFFLGGNPANFPIVRGPQVSLPFCTSTGNCGTQAVTPIGPVLYQAFPYLNLTQTHVNGLDVDLLSHFDIGNAGRMTASINYSHMFHYIFGLQGSQLDLAGTHGPEIISGDTGNPKDRATASLAWDLGPWNVTLSMNYVGHFNLTDPSIGINDCETAILTGGLGGPQGARFAAGPFPAAASPLLNYCDVKAWTDFDLYMRYAFTKNFDVHASVLNLFGQAPPVDLQTYGASGNDPYNPAMHQAGAVGRFFNVGATFTF
jgi:iron complex outermembrane receptor protein